MRKPKKAKAKKAKKTKSAVGAGARQGRTAAKAKRAGKKANALARRPSGRKAAGRKAAVKKAAVKKTGVKKAAKKKAARKKAPASRAKSSATRSSATRSSTTRAKRTVATAQKRRASVGAKKAPATRKTAVRKITVPMPVTPTGTRPAPRTTARTRLTTQSRIATRPSSRAPSSGTARIKPQAALTPSKRAPSKTKGDQVKKGWTPPAEVPREEVIAISDKLLAQPDIPFKETEDVFRIHEVGLDWDMGVMVYEPTDPAKIAVGADGKKIGIFILHGGSGDYKSMEPISRLYTGKFGHKVVAMTFPGRLYLDDPSRDWPNDTINRDGTVRVPIWLKGERITPDQYEVVQDDSKRMRYGLRTVARAKPGTIFYDRMAGWPAAFEVGMKEAMRRHFPEGEFSIYVTGHSTGGPHVFMMCQRVPNIAGVIAVENSPFGFIQEEQHNWSGALGKVAGFERVSKKPAPRTDPFNELYIRTWRDRARYAGPEALGQEGPQALMRLPWLMEEILDWWAKTKMRPQFKAEYIITHNIRDSLRGAAEATAKRLGLHAVDTKALVKRYLGFPYPLTGPGAKPVPPVLFSISKDSRDHSPEVYKEVVLPMFAKIKPTPKVSVTRFGAGVHVYTKPEKDLPVGIGPAVAQYNHDAITGGYFVTD